MLFKYNSFILLISSSLNAIFSKFNASKSILFVLIFIPSIDNKSLIPSFSTTKYCFATLFNFIP